MTNDEFSAIIIKTIWGEKYETDVDLYENRKADVSPLFSLFISFIKFADRYFYIKSELQKALGKNVDLVMASAAKSNKTRAGRRFLDHFEKDKVLLYEQL